MFSKNRFPTAKEILCIQAEEYESGYKADVEDNDEEASDTDMELL